ncbi:MAG: TraB/GumN family protein, partial [Alphaproteobacteria bacterium]|nr:TraB/GumN family protein [Alphaproteobacteria bacterium]
MNRQLAAYICALCLAALCGGGAFAQSPAQKRDADPVLYVVRDSDTTIYLFGTAHLLPADLDWFNDEVKRAFDDSEELYLEIILPGDPSELAPLMSRLAIDPNGRKLSAGLDNRQRRIVSAGLRKLGIRLEEIDLFEPWAVGMQIASLLAVSAGLDPASGAETVLEAEAKGQGKTVRAFETAEEQMTMLDRLPTDEQILSLVETLRDVDQSKKDLSDLIES